MKTLTLYACASGVTGIFTESSTSYHAGTLRSFAIGSYSEQKDTTMEISRTDTRHFNATQQERIETALSSIHIPFELDGNATAYDVTVTTQEQMRTVLATVE